jgi:hypothetical protein
MMNNEKMNQIIDEAYENYTQTKIIKTDSGETHISPIGHYNGMTKEQFINKCKTNPEFSETWGLKIEERELSEKERIIFAGYDYENGGGIGWNMIRETVDMDNSIPRKLITLTYNNETIEVYE